jgi:hypothetical protein
VIRAVRLAAILPVVMWLAACSNRVVSDTPWFSTDSDAGAPHLRSGLWVRTADKKCRFDARQPAETWPTCASGYFVRPHEMLFMNWLDTTEHGRRTHRTYYDWTSEAYVLAGGDPMINQVAGCGDLGPHRVNEDGSPVVPSDPRAYCYAVVRPTEFDAAGRIVGIVTWPVFCGPWPSTEQSDRSGHVVTATPFAGLHVVVDNCTADSEQALRAAARASMAVARSIRLEPVPAHWVRDSYH